MNIHGKIIILFLGVFLYAFGGFSQITVVGHVKDEKGIPVKNATVSTIGRQNYSDCVTDEDGYFELRLVKSIEFGSTITLFVIAKGYSNWKSAEVVAQHKPIEDIMLKRTPIQHESHVKPKQNNSRIDELIENLFSSDYIIKASLRELVLNRQKLFSVNQILKILNAYQKYMDGFSTGSWIDWNNYQSNSHWIINGQEIDGEIIDGFQNILNDLSERQSFSSDDIDKFIKAFQKSPNGSGTAYLLFSFIKRSKFHNADLFLEQLVVSRDGNFYKDYAVKDSAFQYFFEYNNIKDLNFYTDYIDQFKSQHNMVYRPFYQTISSLSSIRKNYVVNILNNKELVDSLLKNGDINYESTFFSIRNQWKQELSQYISINELEKTYFFSLLCPCFLEKDPGSHTTRKFPCDSTKLY